MEFHLQIFSKELVHYTFIWSSNYKEQIFMVPMFLIIGFYCTNHVFHYSWPWKFVPYNLS